VANCLKSNLFIGSSSQLARYWPRGDTEFISSRNIDIEWINSHRWNRIYIAFADGRTFLEDERHFISFYRTNVWRTRKLIDKIEGSCDKVVYFSTTELFNRHVGPISDVKQFDFFQTPYIKSKAIITEELLSRENVIVLFPFQFNSPFRKETRYLFSKIFDSILHKNKITIGNTHFYRELLHPRFVVEQSLKADKSQIIGSGRIVYVADFIKDLYTGCGMSYNVYVREDPYSGLGVSRNIFYLDSHDCLYSYDQLKNDTLSDLRRLF